MGSIVRRWVSLVGLALLAFPLVPALVLLVSAETARGRAFGASVLGLALALWVLEKRPRLSAATTLASLGLAALLAATAPVPVSSPRVESIFLEGAHDRWALASIVPEIDQVVVGLQLVALVDSMIDVREASALGAVVLPIYRRMSEDPELEGLGSVLDQGYSELLGQPFERGHLFVVRPGRRSEKRPAIIFLHGSAGNFRSYVWALRPVSERLGFVLGHPTFGFGNWDRPGGVEAIERVRRHLVEHEDVDPDRIFLIGLSNGGLGVSGAAMAHPRAYRGLVFHSPVFDTDLLDRDELRRDWTGRPMLVITGAADDRVPAQYVSDVVTMLARRGVAVESRVYEGQDHFLWFAVRERALADLEAWLRARS